MNASNIPRTLLMVFNRDSWHFVRSLAHNGHCVGTRDKAEAMVWSEAAHALLESNGAKVQGVEIRFL
jgi:hypothetical protein